MATAACSTPENRSPGMRHRTAGRFPMQLQDRADSIRRRWQVIALHRQEETVCCLLLVLEPVPGSQLL